MYGNSYHQFLMIHLFMIFLFNDYYNILVLKYLKTTNDRQSQKHLNRSRNASLDTYLKLIDEALTFKDRNDIIR